MPIYHEVPEYARWRDLLIDLMIDISRAHICHKYHKLYLGQQNCHVEKFWEILEKFWEFLRIFGNFWGILPQFTHFHLEKN